MLYFLAIMGKQRGLIEFDLHARGSKVDDALANLERIISEARASGPSLFAVITGYGSTGGTSLIKQSVLAACRKYKEQYHIKGYLDGEYAADIFSIECLSFPKITSIPPAYRRFPNPGMIFICV